MTGETGQLKGRVPVPVTRLFGRESDLAKLGELLVHEPVVTITALGGGGKTRVAGALAASRSADDGAVAWVDLQGVTADGQVTTETSRACHLRIPPGVAPVDALTRFLADRAFLLVLDNCETCLAGCAELVAELTSRCPRLRVLATSREPLQVPGETVWQLSPLAVPDGPAAAKTSPAVQCFADRARRAYAGFRLDEESIPNVVAICRQLEGVPLAIELAAALVRVASLAELRAQLEHGIDALGRSSRGLPARHTSMDAALDGSLLALDDSQRTALVNLSVFEGGFDPTAAESLAMLGQRKPDGLQVREILAALVDKSLLVAETGSETARFRMLEPVRQHVREHYAADRWPAIRAGHRDWYLAWLSSRAGHFKGEGRRRAVAAFDLEHDNLSAAWRASVAARDIEALNQMAAGLFWYWNFAGRFHEGRERCESALATLDDDAGEAGYLAHAAGALLWMHSEIVGARRWLREAEKTARRCGDRVLEGLVLRELAGVEMTQCAFAAARDLYSRSVALLAQTEADWDRALACNGHADALQALGDQDKVRAPRFEALALFSELNDPWGRALSLFGLAVGAAMNGERVAARRDGERAARLQRVDGDSWNITQCEVLLGDIDWLESRAGAAKAHYREALRHNTEVGDRIIAAYVIERLADIELRTGQAERAIRLLASTRSRWAQSEANYTYGQFEPLDESEMLASMRNLVDESGFDLAWTRGRATGFDASVAFALQDETGAIPGREKQAPQKPYLEISGLGDVVVKKEGVKLTTRDWGYALPRELLFYLLLNGPCDKERIGADFWPDASQEQLRGRFRTTLYQLRRAIGCPELIRFVDGRYLFERTGDARFDVDEFSAALDRADAMDDRRSARYRQALASALALYSGDLLVGEESGDWVIAHRERLRRRFVDAAVAFGNACIQSAMAGDAIRVLDKAGAMDPFDERLARARARALDASGQRQAALRVLDDIGACLLKELDAEPAAETRALRREIAGGKDGAGVARA